MNIIKYVVLSLSLMPYPTMADILVDPTRPVGYIAPIVQSDTQSTKATSVRQWTLNTTLVSPYQKIAMINGKRLEVGDSINNAVLVAIDHQKVDLQRESDGTVFTIKLHNSFISKINPGSL
jgi:hypothetical protein